MNGAFAVYDLYNGENICEEPVESVNPTGDKANQCLWEIISLMFIKKLFCEFDLHRGELSGPKRRSNQFLE